MIIEFQCMKYYHRRVKRNIRSSINFVLSLLQISTLLINYSNSSSIVLWSKTTRKKEIKYCHRYKTIVRCILSKVIVYTTLLCKLSEINHTKIISRDSLSSNLYYRPSFCDRTIILKIYIIAYLWVNIKESILITNKTKI